MRRLAAGLAACFCVLAQNAARETFQAGISLVHIDAEVLDANHRIITGLRKDDFAIDDDGRPENIVAFAAEEQPLDLVLLFDTSRSMRGVVDRIAKAAQAAFKQLRSGDRVAVMVFNEHSSLLLPMTADLDSARNVVEQSLVKERFGSGTKIQDGVSDAGRQFKSSNNRRRAILIVTDDVGLRTRREDSVVHELWGADASLNGLIVRDEKFVVQMRVTHVLSPGTMLIQAGMRGIAEKTGGDVLQSSEPASAFKDMIHRIRSRFSLYYRMPDAKQGETRHVKVELSSSAQARLPGASVHARRGYIVP